jgi:cation:H+ antiporter
MNMFWAILFLVGGLVALWKCAELLVAGAVGLAKRLGVSPLVIGLTIVAMGTSSPEVAASIAAAARGAGDISIGNVYGSNIANLALIGGLCALIRPIDLGKRILRREIPVMFLSALLLMPVLFNLYLSRPEGVGLLVIFAILIVLTVRLARQETMGAQHEVSNENQDTKPILSEVEGYEIKDAQKSMLFTIIGLAGLALGAEMTLRGGVFVGEKVGLSQAVIGLTIIAVGTSLPELATSLAASVKGHHDISIGNLVGSNIFNTLLVVGTAGTVRPFSLSGRLAGLDYLVMLAVTAAFIIMAVIGRRLSRTDGAILLLGYIVYIVYLLACCGKAI